MKNGEIAFYFFQININRNFFQTTIRIPIQVIQGNFFFNLKMFPLLIHNINVTSFERKFFLQTRHRQIA